MTIRRITALTTLATILLFLIPIPAYASVFSSEDSPRMVSSDEGAKEQKMTGYWKLKETAVRVDEDQLHSDTGWDYSASATELSHMYRAHLEATIYHGESTAVFTATCTAPPNIIRMGDKVVMKIALEMDDAADMLVSQSCGVETGEPNDERNGLKYNVGDRFEATQKGAERKCYMDTCGNPFNPTAEVYYVFDQEKKPGDEMAINFYGCYAATVWIYEWVAEPVKEEEEEEEEPWEDVYDEWIDQKETTQATDKPGEVTTGIDDGVVEGKDHTGGGEYIVVPLGLVTVGGVVFAHSRRKKNKKNKGAKNDKEEKKDSKKPSSYRMVMYKDFGGKLRAGGKAKEVCARIEEIRPNGTGGSDIVKRSDLTGMIRATGIENLEVSGSGMKGEYMAAKVCVPAKAGKDKDAVLEFRFTGEGGSIRNKVVFKILPEAEIVMVNRSLNRARKIENDVKLDLLLGDQEGTEITFGVKNFADAPDEVKIEGAGIQASCERDESIQIKDVFVYKGIISNNYTVQSQFGTWPLEQDITIFASNAGGEEAKAVLKGNLWPEGIFFDTRQIHPDRIENDSILVDSGDILGKAGAEYFIENATMETGVAFKDNTGNVFVDRPNKPDDTDYFRLQALDEEAQNVLSPKEGKRGQIWYELVFEQKPVYSGDERLATLALTPLLPFVTKDETVEYNTGFEVRYEKEDKSYKAMVNYRLKGISAKMNDEKRETEIKRIYTLISAMRLDDMTRVNEVLAKYGHAAEQDHLRFGTKTQQELLEQTEVQLLRTIKEIESLQRLQFIRRMVYEEAELSVRQQRVGEESDAYYYDILYKVAKTVRWIDDMAFTAWWYLMFKELGQYIEPFMTPIKDLFLEYVENLADIEAALDGKTVYNPIDFFDCEKIAGKMMDAIEGSLFNVLVAGMVEGGAGKFTRKELCVFIGLVSTFVFAKNCMKCTEYDPSTQGNKLDIWKALKGTAADLTLDTLKAIVSVAIAKKLGNVFGKEKDDLINPIRKPAVDSLKKLKKSFDDMLLSNRGIAWDIKQCNFGRPETGEEYWGLLKRYCSSQNNSLKADSGFSAIYKVIWKGQPQDFATNELANKELKSTLDYMVNAAAGKFIDIGREEDEEMFNIEKWIDDWAAGFGHTIVLVKDKDGKEERMKIPFLASVVVYVNIAFKKLGLDSFSLGVESLLPEKCPYMSRDELIAKLNKIPGSNKEVKFLNEGSGIEKGVDDSVFTDGAEKPTMDIGTDFHKYAR
ncbi:MAG: hypothetical protein K6F87_03285 [Lachnospiraceae bacterium]|nr:hypothetical protein [Lachnospiraceae bacterium]